MNKLEEIRQAMEGLPDEYDRGAVPRAYEALCSMIEHPKRVRLTITSDFEREVKQAVDDKDYANAYEQERPEATALAKAVAHADGSTDLIVDARIFLKDSPLGAPEKLMRHEGLHVALTERGESLNDIRIRRQGEQLEVHGDLLAMAGVAAEEYRVEAACSGPIRFGEDLEGFSDCARRFYVEVQQACKSYQAHRDLETMASAVLQRFHGLVTLTAYVAAELERTGGAEVKVEPPLDELVIGEGWHEVLSAMRDLPDATAPTERDQLDAQVLEVAKRLEGWLLEIGFDLRANEDGGFSFWIVNPAQWMLSLEEMQGEI